MNPKSAMKVRELAGQLADQEGFEVVDIVASPGEQRLVIRVFIDRAGGVTIDNCRRFSEALETILEVEEAVRGPYVLEVSSPGLTRHLKTPTDFTRAMGKEIEISFFRPDGTSAHAVGTVTEALSGDFRLKTGDEVITIPYVAVKQAKPVIDWRALFRAGEKRHLEDTDHE